MKSNILILIILIFYSCNKAKTNDTNLLIALATINNHRLPTCSVTKKYSDVQANITYNRCTHCHDTPDHISGYDFSTYSNAINSNGKNQVVPGSPDSSTLYLKITTGSMSGRSNQDFNDLIYCWIKAGALQ